MSPDEQVAAWAASGMMALTGRADGPPLGPPEGLVPALRAIARVAEEAAADLGGRLALDPLRLLAQRASAIGGRRGGTTSTGGATRLLAAVDGWVAVSLARPTDVELLPAWLGIDVVGGDPPWAAVAEAVGAASTASLEERAVLLGLPVAALPAGPVPHPVAPAPLAALPVGADRVAGGPAVASIRDVTVVDLGSLWAGPLCGAILAAAGATVVKVESEGRPDGARRGPPDVFRLLDRGKAHRTVALDTAAGVGELHDLLAGATVVIEASRPRALEQLGIDARGLVAGGVRVWASITGHGRHGEAGARVGFGDDAAVAGGLVCRDETGPVLCGDAIADPSSGLVAAAAVLDALRAGDRWLLDVAMSGVAASLAGPTLPASVPAGRVVDPAPIAAGEEIGR